ncbi:MAG: hypothetical protein HQK86_00865 [Nitrospinae bacterium]|nr:hypothetical protein [Nitrospinota bacterium]MBF0634766.1 hypothetical protein [Nitrospinota bacterium]
MLHTESYGHFSGVFGSGLNNAPIPPSCLPEKLRDRVSKSYLMNPISSYISLINTKTRNNAYEFWPADMVAHFGQNIYRDMNCLSAWKVIPYNALVALVDTIKTRILNFVLEIEGEAPDAGEAPPNTSPLPQEKVSHVFNTYIAGNVQNVATGSSQVSQSGNEIVIFGDLKSLQMFLESYGIEDTDIADLDSAIQEDSKTMDKPALGKRVQDWIGKMVGKATTGAWNVSTSVAGTILTKALSQYFGLK